jgi:putative transposase
LSSSLVEPQYSRNYTCARRDRDGLIECIKRQEEHHRRITFEEEYRKLLIEAGIEFDERYLL